jgi:hypothetical protein
MNITLAGWIGLVVVALAIIAIIPFAIREFILWRREVAEEVERASVKIKVEGAREFADGLAARARELAALEITGPIAVVKTTRKGRSNRDKEAVAAAAVLREVDG